MHLLHHLCLVACYYLRRNSQFLLVVLTVEDRHALHSPADEEIREAAHQPDQAESNCDKCILRDRGTLCGGIVVAHADQHRDVQGSAQNIPMLVENQLRPFTPIKASTQMIQVIP